MPKFGKRSLDSLEGVHPSMVKLMTEAIKDSPIDFTIIQGVRTQKTQQEYYSWGRTKINPNTKKMTKVTNADGVTKKSNHQIKADGYGHAIDLYPYLNGSVRTEKVDKEMRTIANHIQKVADRLGIKIRKGIDFKSLPDAPHYELA